MATVTITDGVLGQVRLAAERKGMFKGPLTASTSTKNPLGASHPTDQNLVEQILLDFCRGAKRPADSTVAKMSKRRLSRTANRLT